MSSMMWCGLVQNFYTFFLLIQLYTCGFTLFTTAVHSFLLIMRQVRHLSTILYFGAKLISLYLFPANYC